MSIYSIKGKGWRYDFTINGIRYTEAWFKTKTEAKQAEAKKREEVKNPKPQEKTPTDMAFLDLVNLKLDYVKAYNSERHYTDLHISPEGIEICMYEPCLISEFTPREGGFRAIPQTLLLFSC